MAAQVLALYNKPADPTHFEQYYYGTHVAIAKQLPGLKKYTTNKGAIGAPDGVAAYYLVAILEFDSMEAIQSAFASPQGQAAVEDVSKFATGGISLLMYETQAV